MWDLEHSLFLNPKEKRELNTTCIFSLVQDVKIIAGYLQWGITSILGPSAPQEGLREQQLHSCSLSPSLTSPGSQGWRWLFLPVQLSFLSFFHVLIFLDWYSKTRVYFTYTWLWWVLLVPHLTSSDWGDLIFRSLCKMWPTFPVGICAQENSGWVSVNEPLLCSGV